MLAISTRLGAAVGLLAGGAGAPAIAAAAEAASLAPHRAVYEIVLDNAKVGAGIADLSGRMVYELTGSVCQGYTQNMRFVTRMTSQEGQATVNDIRSTTIEEAAARSMKFSSSQYRDDQQTEVTVGDATRASTDGTIKAEVSKPKKTSLALTAETLFPVQHSIALLEAAKAGKSIFAADLYDGSDKGEKVFATTAVIGNRQAPGRNSRLPPAQNGEILDRLPSWAVSLSYFDKAADKSDSAPAYELAFLFFENGVSRRLFIDYGDFSIRGLLKEITFLDEIPCTTK